MSSQIHEDGRVFDAQMTSCALRYDVIYHPSPINSQYLNTSGVDSPVSALYGKEFLIKCLLDIDTLVDTGVDNWSYNVGLNCANNNQMSRIQQPQFNDNNRDFKIQPRDGNENVA